MLARPMEPGTITVETLSYADVAKTIDHSLLRPELDLTTVEEGCRLARRYDVASATLRPADVAVAAALLEGSEVLAGAVVGFPHGSSLTATKVFETERALEQGAREIDMVLNIGRLRSGRDDEVLDQIRAVVEACGDRAVVKVIFENAYLADEQKVRACRLSEEAGAAFVKTSTGFAPTGATLADLELMRRSVSPHIQVKAAGGVRTLDALLEVMNVGVTRIGARRRKRSSRTSRPGSSAGPRLDRVVDSAPAPGLTRRPAAVDGEHDARDEAGCVAREVEGGAGDVLRTAEVAGQGLELRQAPADARVALAPGRSSASRSAPVQSRCSGRRAPRTSRPSPE